MPSWAGVFVFLYGLTSGIAILTITSYRHVSPWWLKGLLIASGLLVISRYLTLALFTIPDAPQRFWTWRHCWFGTSLGLTFPSVVALDQLLRHPAMTPQKLLARYAPFGAVYIAVMLFAPVASSPDRLAGWTLHLTPGWRWGLEATQTGFVLGFLGLGALLIRQVPVRPIRIAIGGLMLAQAALGMDGLLVSLGVWYPRPFLFSELLALLALWHAFETGAALQRAP